MNALLWSIVVVSLAVADGRRCLTGDKQRRKMLIYVCLIAISVAMIWINSYTSFHITDMLAMIFEPAGNMVIKLLYKF